MGFGKGVLYESGNILPGKAAGFASGVVVRSGRRAPRFSAATRPGHRPLFAVALVVRDTHGGPDDLAFLAKRHDGCRRVPFPRLGNRVRQAPIDADPLCLIPVVVHAVLAEPRGTPPAFSFNVEPCLRAVTIVTNGITKIGVPHNAYTDIPALEMRTCIFPTSLFLAHPVLACSPVENAATLEGWAPGPRAFSAFTP